MTGFLGGSDTKQTIGGHKRVNWKCGDTGRYPGQSPTASKKTTGQRTGQWGGWGFGGGGWGGVEAQKRICVK